MNPPARGGPGAIRLIGGRWKRTRLVVPVSPGLRPTPDRVRETLFNWLGQDLAGWRCLDAFAGTGALGLEAASRGAASVLMVERDRQLLQALRATVERLHAQDGVTLLQGDGLAALRSTPPASLDLVFLDPPYDSGLLAPALEAAARALRPGGLVYAEDRGPLLACPAGLEPWRQSRAGAVHAHLLRRAP